MATFPKEEIGQRAKRPEGWADWVCPSYKSFLFSPKDFCLYFFTWTMLRGCPLLMDKEQVSWRLGRSTNTVYSIISISWLKSFFRALFSQGCLVVSRGASEASSHPVRVEAVFYHLLHPAWCCTQSWSQYNWLDRIVFQEEHEEEEPRKPVMKVEDSAGSTGHVPGVLEPSCHLLHV